MRPCSATVMLIFVLAIILVLFRGLTTIYSYACACGFYHSEKHIKHKFFAGACAYAFVVGVLATICLCLC